MGDEPGTGIGVAMAGRLTPVQAAHPQQGTGHRGASIACAHHGTGPPVAHRFGAAHEGGVPLHPNGSTRVLVHADDFAGRLDGNAGLRARVRSGRLGHRPEGRECRALWRPGGHRPPPRRGPGRPPWRRPLLAARRGPQPCRAVRHLRTGRTTGGHKERAVEVYRRPRARWLAYVDGLAALVPATVRADGVRHLGLAALGANAARWEAHFPRAGPPAARLGLGGLFLRYGHGLAILHALGTAASARPAQQVPRDNRRDAPSKAAAGRPSRSVRAWPPTHSSWVDDPRCLARSWPAEVTSRRPRRQALRQTAAH